MKLPLLLVALFGASLAPGFGKELRIPAISDGPPVAGNRVIVTPTEYAGTGVHHVIYLPASWKQEGPSLPIIFEYTGNHWPPTGSSGRVDDAALGYGLSGGEFIWVTLPFVGAGGQNNALSWWGDIDATVDYAKLNVPRIVDKFNADSDAVILCGFSRGAIGVNFIVSTMTRSPGYGLRSQHTTISTAYGSGCRRGVRRSTSTAPKR